MTDIRSIGFALDPTNTPSFLIDWEITKFCNLDCTYCSSSMGIASGHDNTTKHPSLEECLKTIDFMYEYVDLYMQHKKPSQRKVILNIYGGESLHHPNIVEIFEEARRRYEPFKDKWYLTFICTTNGVVGERRLDAILPYVDEFTLSYHVESLPKQKEQFFDNLIKIKETGTRLTVSVMMHNNPTMWDECVAAVDFCNEHGIKCYPKTIDNVSETDRWHYTQEQTQYLGGVWAAMANNNAKALVQKKVIDIVQEKTVSVIHKGRACCGGRKLSVNGDLKTATRYVPAQGFRGWYCSVNWFFVYIRQLDGAVFTNRDCQMSLCDTVAPIGYLNDCDAIVDDLMTKFTTGTMPQIVCGKDICKCGFCAPKAQTKSEFAELISRYVVGDVFGH